jgi:hypothetical protein
LLLLFHFFLSSPLIRPHDFSQGELGVTRVRADTHTHTKPIEKKKIPTAPIIDFRSATSTSRAPLCKKKTTTTTHFCFVFVFVFPMEIKICGGLLGDDDKS